MEQSSYLQRFDNTKRQMPYKNCLEADLEEENLLLLLLDLMEKRRAGNTLEFAAMDWEAARLHVESRKHVSEKFQVFPTVSRIARSLSLNQAEWLALLLAAVFIRGRIAPGSLSRIRGEQKRDQASAETARRIGDFLWLLENQIRRVPREIMRQERLLLFLEQGSLPSEAELPMRLRRPVMEKLYASSAQEKTQGQNDHVQNAHAQDSPSLLWKRKTPKDSPEKILIYNEIFEQMYRMCLAKTGDWTLCLLADEGSGKEFLAGNLASALNRVLFVIEGSAWEDGRKEAAMEAALDLISSCLLSEPGALLYLNNPPPALFTLLRFYLPGLILVGRKAEQKNEGNTPEEARNEKEMQELSRKWICLALPLPTASQKGRLWEYFLAEYPHTKETDPKLLGNRYVLNAGGIRRVLDAAAAWAAGNQRSELDQEDILWAVHQSQWGQLGAYAAEIPCVFTWEDFVVEPAVKSRLMHFCDQLKYRSLVGNDWGFFNKMPYGKGMSALFYGPPGTGKTMAAQVIARELGLDLYRVDLSRMVSKYIGETEKHISDLFAKASHMNVILFFDEADAFFSRRMEVKDANDRNANSEVAHLLQKLEEYDGVTILATNLKENMDDAFKRRIQFMVNFPLPSPKIRRELWHSLLPAQAPKKSDLALDFFAERFELSGSQIKEILLNAAYIAAAQKEPIGNAQIKEALCLNCEKYGKRLTEEDFGYLAYD